MRDAGISAAQSQGNVAWVNVATDGTPVFNAWHEDIDSSLPASGLVVYFSKTRPDFLVPN
jgi:hypothetical protein